MAARKKKKGGRPKGSLSKRQHPSCKLTEKIIREFAEDVEKGNFRTPCRQRLGISQSTYDKWIQTGKRQIQEYEKGKRKHVLLQGRFVLALDRAEGFVNGKMTQDILEHGSIRAKMWFLERRFPKLYAHTPGVAIDDETGREVEIDAAALLAERLKVLIRRDDD